MAKIRWGLIGCGDIAGKKVVPAFQELPGCELAAVSSRNPGKAARFAEEHGAPRYHGRWEDLVRDVEIDAVYVATPHFLHAEQTIAAAEAGKHVLCEKPMAIRVSECEDMIRACDQNGVKLGVSYYRHFYPVIDRIKELLGSRAIGKAILCQINSFTRYDLEPGDPQHWMFEKEKSGGGPLMAGGCHRIEVLINLFGPVIGCLSTMDNILVQREIEDTAVAVLRFEGGPLGVLSMSHSIEEKNDTLHIFGSGGSIHTESLGSGEISVESEGAAAVEHHPPASNSHVPLIESFCNAIDEDTVPPADGGVGLAVQRVEEEIYFPGA